MKRVYLSGPITHGDRSWNLYQSLQAQKMLLLAGYAAWNPMLTMLHPDEKKIPWDVWLESDLAWIECADVVIRLPGRSKGADAETEFARGRHIPVVYVASLNQLRQIVDNKGI